MADLVLKNATYVNIFSGELITKDIAVAEGIIAGLGCYDGKKDVDMTCLIVCPGFIDAHIHLESSLVSPVEFARAVLPQDLAVDSPKGVIGIIPGQIITEKLGFSQGVDTEKDILKMAVIERHKNTGHIGIGYLSGYGLKAGAVATSVAHDSHNIICVGCNNEDIAFAANCIAENHGGIVVVRDSQILALLPLEIGGIMSNEDLPAVNEKLENAKAAAYRLGVNRDIDPFMTLSFMSLPVIPTLRLNTRGVVDTNTQQYI